MNNKQKSIKPNCEEVLPYNGEEEKSKQVEQMFDTISPSYDLMNTAMSFGLHKFWRNCALKQAMQEFDADSELHILDVATGTGDVALELNHRFPNAIITGIDISDGMLSIARQKLDNAGEGAHMHVTFRHGDSLSIHADNDTFDLVTVAYGVRNFQSLEKGYREIFRVLKPGGKLCVIELSEPENQMIHAGYRFYSRTLIPRLGKLVSGDFEAYQYLLNSISEAPQRDDMTRLMQQAGFKKCRWTSLTMGVVTIYWAEKE